MLKQGFPEWFEGQESVVEAGAGAGAASSKQEGGEDASPEETEPNTPATKEESQSAPAPPPIAHVLHYLRLIFTAPEILDAVPLASAANPSAWHAWRSHRSKTLGERAQSPTAKPASDAASSNNSEGSLSPRAPQPGGARRPGEWNWSGVWEDRVRKVVAASRAEGTLFGGGEGGEVVSLFSFSFPYAMSRRKDC